MRNFDHRFPLRSGVNVYVQGDAARKTGHDLCNWIEKRWSPPKHFYHFRDGGHVAAARLHQAAPFILGLDLRRFFDQVTRTKVHRTLRRIGFRPVDAYELACTSTVTKDGQPGVYSLPFGFVQSMHLASLALHYSALGRAMLAVKRKGVHLSVYVDDVLLSADDLELVNQAHVLLRQGAEEAGFAFNPDKTRGPADAIQAFNLRIGQSAMAVVDNRLNEFRQTVLEPPPEPAEATIAYVRTVNGDQADTLLALRAAAGL